MSSPFIRLQLLDYILKEKGTTFNKEDIGLISVQHLLETTGAMFETVVKLGITPDNILVMGKLYSTNQSVVSNIKSLGIEVQTNVDSDQLGTYHELFINDCKLLWAKFEKKILEKKIKIIVVLDDGGSLIATVPKEMINKYCVIGVEQTTSGIELNKMSPIPIINVAGSAIKRFIEPAFISQAVIRKVRRYLLGRKPKSIGIFGNGNIGRALITDLSRHFPVSVFDVVDTNYKSESIKKCFSADELFLGSDLIIGATGKDISSTDWLKRAGQNKIMFSVSSGDIEFKSLLVSASQYLKRPIRSLLDDLEFITEDGFTITLLRGGTPVNFDNNIHSVLPEHIQLTRSLLILGVIQAIESSHELCGNNVIKKLDPSWQRKLLSEWIKLEDISKFEFPMDIHNAISDISVIENKSLGAS